MTSIHNILRYRTCHSRPCGGKMMTTQHLGAIYGMSEAGMEWTEQRIEMLRRLWGQGQTASQIAVALGGVTR
ncbi:MAG TPA: GcrA family cell cycle regulator, partial [Dongiaceae bacterium]|nr:GcrA family cell cycle regulator [Dongiaceae bacterium]